jgi:hypothetical protein
MAYVFRCHRQVCALGVPRNRVACTSRFDEIIQIPNRANLTKGEGSDSEITSNYDNNHSVEVVG